MLPVGVLEEKRRGLNQALQAAGEAGKISFTHLIAYGAGAGHQAASGDGPHACSMQDGRPYRVAPDGIELGLAVDVQRKDGSRGLVVPVIKRADAMDFAAFHAAYEALVEKARTNRLMPDDFAGATMSLTNPGGLGTVASVPRLMAGQGSIIAVGAIGYPAEFSAVPEERLREFGISKVMTVTSTYDHRVIQGAESGAFLGTVDRLLQGDEGFYDLIAESLRLGQAGVPAREAAPAAQPGRRAAGPVAPEMLYHVAAAMALVKAFRMHGHLAAHLDPLGTPPIGDPALDPEPARPHARGDGGDSVAGAAHRRARRHAGRVAALPPGHLLRHHGLRDRAHLDPRGAGLAPGEDRVRRLPPADDARASSASCCSG